MKCATAYLTALSILFLGSCAKKEQHKRPPPTVTVTPVIQKAVPLYIEGIGHVEPINKVDLKAQVTGVVTGSYFRRGTDVKKGDLLVTIDPRPYETEVQAAQARLASDIATFKYAEDTAKRNAPLAQEDYVSQETYDNLVTNVMTSNASIRERQAQLDDAQINLGYCTIHAPMDGRTSDLMIDPGNLVLENANETIVTINQITPIYTSFAIPERYLTQIQRRMREGPVPVKAWLDGTECHAFDGILDIIDNQVDSSTGMINMKANMPNEDKFLWPNQFVTCHIIMKMLDDALLAPEAAIQNSTKGKYVWIVDKDNIVKKQMVEVGQRHDPSLRVITKGLKPGQNLVLEGQINLTDGVGVTVKASKTAEEAVEVERQLEQLGMPP